MIETNGKREGKSVIAVEYDDDIHTHIYIYIYICIHANRHASLVLPLKSKISGVNKK